MSAAGTEGGRSQLCGVPGAQASRTCGSGVNGRHRPSQGMLVFQPWLQEGRFCVKSTHLKNAYIYIYGCTGSSSVLRLSLVAESGAPLQLWRAVFSLQWLFRGGRLRSCGTQV